MEQDRTALEDIASKHQGVLARHSEMVLKTSALEKKNALRPSIAIYFYSYW